MVEGMVSHRVPERSACFLNVALAKMVLTKVSVIMGPVAHKRTAFGRSRRADRTVFLKEPLPSQQGSLRGDIARGVSGIEAVTVQRLGQVYD